MDFTFTLENIQNTAQSIWEQTKQYKVFALHGEMGAGKTTFVHALCEVIGVQDMVSSPTFSIINEYATRENDIIYHIDLYRLKDEAEAIAGGVEDCLLSGHTCLVEWPDKAPGILPDNTLHLFINLVDERTRRISFQSIQ